ncbi:MAG: acyl-CoA dehydratase activase [Deltaproteobacteria bacterium]|nr:acyl-CoA dehydratase activase [Deltaproteobacteria bacterium]
MGHQNTLCIGLDCGSSFCKGALGLNGEIVGLASRPTGWDVAGSAALVKAELLKGYDPKESLVRVVATGYGRELIKADKIVTEITCHAKGAELLAPQTRLVLDIGGQDYKAIATLNGQVISFQMNDKCAAGSGRFLEVILKRLEVDLSQLDEFLAAGQAITLNSACVVFAETEIIGLLASGVSRADILGGVVASLAQKIASQAARLDPTGPAALTGGLAQNLGVAKALGQALGLTVRPLLKGPYAGALGAALIALDID